MKTIKFILLGAFLIHSQLQAQTTRVKEPRQLEAQKALNISYVDCKVCGFGLYILRIQKQGHPSYNLYRKNLRTGEVQIDFKIADNVNAILANPCEVICNFYANNQY
ncbi:MAG: hypothetical protein ABI851_04180 [Saprospiraceae bacterium]